MPIFDFHCHPSMKSQYAQAGKEPSPWDNISVELNVLNDIKLKISPWMGDSLDSQSSLSQLHKAGVNLIGLALYATENNIANGLLSKSIIRNNLIKQINAEKLQTIVPGNHYFKQIETELNFLIAKSKAPAKLGLPAGTQLKIIKSISEYVKTDTNTIHAFLVIEGLHSLMNNPFASSAKNDFFTNLDKLMQHHRIFAVNLTHLQQMPLANHASGMQFLNDEDYFPTGSGMSSLGSEIVESVYNKGILIDVKHLGMWSRMSLYNLRNQLNVSLPLICTHAGITGIRMNERVDYMYEKPKNIDNKVWRIKYYKKLGHVKYAAFNLTSINLYDEDILEIIGSKGLIGISLDQRIVGYPMENITHAINGFAYDEEYISMQEQKLFFGNKNPASIKPIDADDTKTLSGDAVEDQNTTGLSEVHLYYFWNQVLHILNVAKNNIHKGFSVADASKRICLGSDFDGLINPIDCCLNATFYKKFKANLVRVSNEKGFWKNSGFAKNEIDVTKLLDDLFFNNAHEFLKVNFI